MMNKKSKEATFTRVFDLLSYQQSKYPQKKAINKYVNGKWVNYSIETIRKEADRISLWMLAHGFEKNEKVIVVPRMGKAEWMIFDFACQQIGLITVPVHANATDEEIAFIIQESEARFCLTDDAGLYYKFQLIAKEAGLEMEVKHLEAQTAGYFEGLKAERLDEEVFSILEEHKANVKEDDLIAIMYTPGPDGIPKGIMLSHKNIVSNILSIMAVFPLEPSKRVLSFLPYSHIYERTSSYAYIAYGVELYFSVNRDSIIHDFKTVRPYFCTTVPRLLEKMYEYLQSQLLERSWVRRQVVKQAFSIASEYKQREKHSLAYKVKLFIVRQMVLNPTKRQLGGKLKCMAVGAAALRPDIARLFSAGGIKIREGYGLTETSPFVSLNRFDPGMNRFGTVGIPVPGVEVRIDSPDEGEEGEILVRGQNVTRGYYKRPDLTREVITPEGWLRTGDIGYFVDKKFLKITDRKKDIFKTSAGRYIAPRPLEDLMVASPFISQSLVIGFQRPFVSALIVPNFKILKSWCEAEGIHWTAPAYMLGNIKVKGRIMKELEIMNEELPNYKRIRNFILCEKEWTVEGGEMSNNFIIHRKKLQDQFKKEIDALYESIS